MLARSTLLALDPGLNNPAAAVFANGRLVAACRIKPEKAWRELDVAERCRLVAQRIRGWECIPARVDELVVEWPQVYTRSKSKGDPNDLLPLVGVAMALAGRLGARVRSYKPAEWIGQCPKKETGDPLESPRGRLIWRLLDAAERSGVTPSHDALDAVGIGLFALGRLHRHVYPGAT